MTQATMPRQGSGRPLAERPSRVLPRLAPGAVLVVGAAACLVATGTPVGATVAYILYAALAVLLPGVLVVRQVPGLSENLLSAIAWGGVVGLMLELAGWALFTTVGINGFLWLWPALIVAAFAVVPRLRSSWTGPADRELTSPVAAWGVTLASLLAFAHLAVTFYRVNPPPPSGMPYSVDLPWHVGVAYEAQRTVMLQPPEALVEGPLHYHWFSNAHFASASLISRVDLPTVITRPGLYLLVFIMVIATAALAWRLTRRGLVAGLAALLVVSTTAGIPMWGLMHSVRLLYADSPSGIYAAPTSCLIAVFVIDALRGRRWSGRAMVLFGACLFMAVGSKPSVLIVLLPAAALCGLVELVRTRRIDWRLVAVGVAMASAILVSVPLFSSSGGSSLDLNVASARVMQAPLYLLVAGALIKSYWLFFTSMAALALRAVRVDVAARFLACATLVGFAEAWLIYHPGLSQRFFWSSAMPLAATLTAWGVVAALPSAVRQRRRVAAFTAVAVVAFTLGFAWARFDPIAKVSLRPGWLALAAVAVVLVVAWAVLRSPARPTLLLAMTVPVALTLPTGIFIDAALARPVTDSPAREAETRAALWVRDNVPTEDVLATNSHCLGPTAAGRYCDARSFWVSGFSGHRVLLEGYGVSPSALRLTGQGGYPAWWQPYHDQPLQRLNDSAFTDPDESVLRELADEHDVRWLVASSARGEVSPALASLARVAYTNDTVTVYELEQD